jgi:predicted glycogen debranching enzyme
MDAKMGEWVVTPRTGKPVEVNALWYHALSTLAEMGDRLGRPMARYDALARRTNTGFRRFWNASAGYCYDVIDGPEGNDSALRPNQLLAVSLLHSPLTDFQQKAVVDACARSLLTSHGLRSLAQKDRSYEKRYGGDLRYRLRAYHQGTVWAWWLGPLVDAHLRVYKNVLQARSLLQPMAAHLRDHGLGTISEIFDAEPPFTPRGAIAQAWSVAEVLRAWVKVNPR